VTVVSVRRACFNKSLFSIKFQQFVRELISTRQNQFFGLSRASQQVSKHTPVQLGAKKNKEEIDGAESEIK